MCAHDPNTLYLFVCVYHLFYEFHMPACSCVCMFAEFVSTWYKQEALVSVFVPRALLSHDQMT